MGWDWGGGVENSCPLKLQQHGHTKASSSYADSEGTEGVTFGVILGFFFFFFIIILLVILLLCVWF